MTTLMIQLVFGMTVMIQPAMDVGPRFIAGFQPTSQPEKRANEMTEASKPRREGSKVDEQLVRRLLGGQSSAVDAVEQTLSRMEEASEGLRDRLDPGEKTQVVQKQILVGIDKLIEEASKNRAATRDQTSTVRRRQAKPSGRSSAGASQKAASQGKAPAASSRPADDHPQTARGERGKGEADKADLTRGWGFLPQRDRDEISQGFDEQFPAKYRERIMEYYRSLAEEAQRSAE